MPSGISGYLNPELVSLGLALASFFTSKHNFSGPLRYGVSKHGPNLQALYQKSPDGTLWVLLLLRAVLPWTQTWLVSALSVAWQYTVQHFREDVRAMMDEANNIYAKTSIALDAAKEDVTVAARYEQDALAHAAETARDSRRANGIKASDFFSAASDMWAAVRATANIMDEARSVCSKASYEAENSRKSYPNHSGVDGCASYMRSASSNADDASRRAQAASKILADAEEARDQDRKARQAASYDEGVVTKATQKLLQVTANLPEKLSEVTKSAQAVRHKVSEAVAKAEQGKLDEAKELMAEAATELEELEGEAEEISEAKTEVRRIYVSQILGLA
jgi:hypothetical protein